MSADAALSYLLPRLGTEIGLSNWHQIDQAVIDSFAKTTHDQQWIHVDPARSRSEGPFGTTIAHGFLTLSMASVMSYEAVAPLEGVSHGLNYGFDRLRFLRPVLADERIRGRFVLKEASLRSPTELKRCHILTVEIEGSDTPALVADWLTLDIFP